MDIGLKEITPEDVAAVLILGYLPFPAFVNASQARITTQSNANGD